MGLGSLVLSLNNILRIGTFGILNWTLIIPSWMGCGMLCSDQHNIHLTEIIWQWDWFSEITDIFKYTPDKTLITNTVLLHQWMWSKLPISDRLINIREMMLSWRQDKLRRRSQNCISTKESRRFQKSGARMSLRNCFKYMGSDGQYQVPGESMVIPGPNRLDLWALPDSSQDLEKSGVWTIFNHSYLSTRNRKEPDSQQASFSWPQRVRYFFSLTEKWILLKAS